MRNKLLNLFGLNKDRGHFRAETSEGQNVIWLYDFIVSSEDEALWWGGVSAEGFAKQLNAMSGPVTVMINSPGGDVFGGRAMAQAMRDYPDPITVQINGYAASAASTVAIAADKVMAAPDAMVMIHRAWTITLGNGPDHLATAELLEKIDGGLVEAYAAKGDADADWMGMIDRTTWLTAAEAQALGLVDEVMPARAAKAENSISWNMTPYENAPAPAPVPNNAPAPEEQPAAPDDGAAARIAAHDQRERAIRMALATA